MPRIDDEILDCVIYLYETVDAAKQNNIGGATGFIVCVPVEVAGSTECCYYAVTNDHVIDDRFLVVRLNTHNGESVYFECSEGQWHSRPDKADLAICRLPIDISTHKFKAIQISDFITKTILDECDIGIGDDVLMVGRFSPHAGTKHNLPALRFGNISMMPLEPRKGKDFYIVEMRSITGYSGSPVFVYIPQADITSRPKEIPQNYQPFGRWVLGVDTGHIKDKELLRDKDGTETIDKWQVESNSGMAVVVPIERLRELLYSDEAEMERNDMKKP